MKVLIDQSGQKPWRPWLRDGDGWKEGSSRNNCCAEEYPVCNWRVRSGLWLRRSSGSQGKEDDSGTPF